MVKNRDAIVSLRSQSPLHKQGKMDYGSFASIDGGVILILVIWGCITYYIYAFSAFEKAHQAPKDLLTVSERLDKLQRQIDDLKRELEAMKRK